MTCKNKWTKTVEDDYGRHVPTIFKLISHSNWNYKIGMQIITVKFIFKNNQD